MKVGNQTSLGADISKAGLIALTKNTSGLMEHETTVPNRKGTANIMGDGKLYFGGNTVCQQARWVDSGRRNLASVHSKNKKHLHVLL